MRNVGRYDRLFRLILALSLLGIGLFLMNGITGNIWGIVVALTSLLPFYMVITAKCFVFRWLKVHSLSKRECEKYGTPYKKG